MVAREPRWQESIFETVYQLHGTGLVHAILEQVLGPPAAAAAHDEQRDVQHAGQGDPTAGAHDETRTRVADAGGDQQMHARRLKAGFEQLARTRNKIGHAPSEIRLPASVVASLDKAWQESLTGGKEDEQGGNVVRTMGGGYRLRRGGVHDDDEFDPDWNDVGWTETMVGVAHTHPYLTYDHASFSDVDLVNLIDYEQPVNILRSGPFTYLVARTREFDALVRSREEADTLFELRVEMQSFYAEVYARASGDLPEKVEAAVVAFCKRYDLLYYQGQGADLTRVSPAPKPKR